MDHVCACSIRTENPRGDFAFDDGFVAVGVLAAFVDARLPFEMVGTGPAGASGTPVAERRGVFRVSGIIEDHRRACRSMLMSDRGNNYRLPRDSRVALFCRFDLAVMLFQHMATPLGPLSITGLIDRVSHS